MKFTIINILTLICCLDILTACAGGFTRLTKKDISYQMVPTIATGLDGWQTSKFKNTPGRYERNPTLSSQPSKKELTVKVPLAIAGQFFITWALPRKHRRKWQSFLTVVESGCVIGNYQLGVRIK